MLQLIVGLIVDQATRSHEQAGCAQLKSERLYGGALLNSGKELNAYQKAAIATARERVDALDFNDRNLDNREGLSPG